MFDKTTRQIGNRGEDLACEYLKKQGYKILGRNFYIRGGEIDIIAKDKDTLVFVEVKARFSDKFGLAREAVTSWKIRSLIKSAEVYIAKNRLGSVGYRFDLVAIDDTGHDIKIELIQNIIF